MYKSPVCGGVVLYIAIGADEFRCAQSPGRTVTEGNDPISFIEEAVMLTRFIVFIVAVCMVAVFSASLLLAHPAHVCRACGEKIEGAFFETHGNYFHPDCFSCEYCNQPIKDTYIIYRNQNYHSSCFEKNVARRCAVCEEIIQGEYLLDYWGNSVHRWHEGKVVQCDFCRRFIVGPLVKGMVRFPDGRKLCGKCGPKAVNDLKEAESLMFEVASRMEEFGMDVDCRAVELALVGRNELRKLASGRSYDTTGFADYAVKKNLFGHIKEQTTKVYLLYGMPKIQMISTLAHELAHVWQFLNGQLNQNKVLSEGSCNFSSYLVLRKIGGSEAEFIIDTMLEDKDPVYGDGFRRVKRYVENEGINDWLQLLKKKPALSAF